MNPYTKKSSFNFNSFKSIEFIRKTIRITSIIFALFSAIDFIGGFLLYFQIIVFSLPPLVSLCFGIILSMLSGFTAIGFWKYKNWSRSIVFSISILTIAYFFIYAVFDFSTIVFGGKQITPLPIIFQTFINNFIVELLKNSIIPIALIFILRFQDKGFTESQSQRNFFDRIIKTYITFHSIQLAADSNNDLSFHIHGVH